MDTSTYPRLSIVIPAHNEEDFIGACLDAVMRAISHTSYDVEIIVVNNASTDRTRAVAERYPGVEVIDESRKGTNQARDTGFRAATGDLIGNIDADTTIDASWLHRAYAAFERQPNLVALSGPYTFAETPRVARVLITVFYLLSYPIALVNRIFGRGAFIIGGNVVMRKTALQAIHGYNTSYTFYGDDTDTAMRLSTIGRVRFDYRFTVTSSNRRLAKEGLLATGARYALNYLWVTVFGKPYTKSSKDIRSRT